MAQYNINGQIYVDFRDVKEFLNENTLKKELLRARRSYEMDGTQLPSFHNIDHPADGRKRLLLLATLPTTVQMQIIEHLSAAAQNTEAALRISTKFTPQNTTQIAVSAVQKTVEVSEPFVAAQISEYIRLHHAQYIPYYMERITNINSIAKYAKTCAFAAWCILQNADILSLNLTAKEYNRWRRALRTIIQNLMYDGSIAILVPTNDKGFTEWFDNLVLQIADINNVTEYITIRRVGNINSRKITERIANLIVYYAVQGNALPKKQIYAKLMEVGKIYRFTEWINKAGEFKPPTFVAVSEYIKNNEKQISYQREGAVKHYLKYVHQINREQLSLTNAMWGIDGTALDANVYVEYDNGKSKVYQGIYMVFVFDYASMRLLGIATTKAPTRGDKRTGETKELLTEAVVDAIRFTGYKPSVLQSDHHAILSDFCENNSIKALPAKVGNARTKNIEGLFGMFGNLITRNMPSWTGQNMTANGANSKPSETYRKEGYAYAPKYATVVQWLKNEARNYWNNHIIETMDGSAINKTPNMLWNEMNSFTLKMSSLEYAKLTGTPHTVQFTTVGAEIKNNNTGYTYYPNLTDEKQRNWLIYEQRSMFKKTTSLVTLYVTTYGEDVHVFDHDDTYLGLWCIKAKVPMNATIINDTKEYNLQREIQKTQVQYAKTFCENAVSSVQNMENFEDIKRIGEEFLTGKLDKAGFEADQQNNNTTVLTKNEKTSKAKDYKGSLNKEELNYSLIEFNEAIDNFLNSPAETKKETKKETKNNNTENTTVETPKTVNLEDKLNSIFG